MIKIVGLGPGSIDSLTIGTIEVLKNSKNTFLRTSTHPTVQYLKEQGYKFETYDDFYEKFESFEEVYSAIAEDIIKKDGILGNLVYAVPGHPLVAEKSVINIIKLCRENNIEYEIVPAVSFIDVLMERLKIDPINGLKIIDAFDIKNQVIDKRCGTIITQVYDNYIASEVKLSLMETLDDDTQIYFIRAAGVKNIEIIRKIKLYELDRQQEIDHLTSIYIPECTGTVYDFKGLLDIMDILRSEKGCPWDKEQNHESLKKYLIEECYETTEAIDNCDDDAIVEELGDVLLQIVFHSKLGKEEGFFDINDVIEGICIKMIERHPHVFGETTVKNSDEVLTNWSKLKKKEQGHKTHTEVLRHIPTELPALMKAYKVQLKAAEVGFDWDDIECAIAKVREEYYEVLDVYKTKNEAKILEEIGDLLFSVVNLARFLDIDPENALNYTIGKFISRFEFIEKSATEKGQKLQDMSLDEMDELWEKAKINLL